MATAFADLGLGAEVLRAVSEAGYEQPTPIQEEAIPYILMNRDVLGCAQTGTGKTASFTLPMIDILAQGRARARMPRSVILEPTRELAAQVAENFEIYGKFHKLNMALLIGGVSFSDQDKKLDRGVDVLIATPGRLLDHCERGKVILTDTKILVIDEGDRMLDMGFIPDVERIASLMPKMRQTVMFSATMPKEIRRLADKFLINPKEVTVDPPSSAADTVEQSLVNVSKEKKERVLKDLLRATDIQNALIFCNRKRAVADLYRSLAGHGLPAGPLHGDMDQYKRMEWLEKFRSGDITMLVCSDVAARGLDISAVSHVFNYDVPVNAEDYIHRIGRTGRAGRRGQSITLATRADSKAVAEIERLVGRKIPVRMQDGLEQAEAAPRETAAAPRESKSGSQRQRSGRPAKSKPSTPAKQRRGAASENRDDSAVVGMGDHVPAFLQRPTKT